MVGDANDYIGKGLSGGRIVLRPHPQAPKTQPGVRQVIQDNTVAYGATAGEIFIRGRVGERFAVRNSGALLVVEGTAVSRLRVHDRRPGGHPRQDRS